MPALKAMLEGWLESGTIEQQVHARNRLSLPDAVGFEMPSGYAPESDMERAARLIAENPPTNPVPLSRGGCGGCPGTQH